MNYLEMYVQIQIYILSTKTNGISKITIVDKIILITLIVASIVSSKTIIKN